MSKKKKFVILGLAALAIVTALVILLGQPKPLRPSDYERVCEGMTPEEVHAIMGQPNRVFRGVRSYVDVYGGGQVAIGDHLLIPGGYSDTALIVYKDDRVDDKSWVEADRTKWWQHFRRCWHLPF
jgi:hypothetical protein